MPYLRDPNAFYLQIKGRLGGEPLVRRELLRNLPIQPLNSPDITPHDRTKDFPGGTREIPSRDRFPCIVTVVVPFNYQEEMEHADHAAAGSSRNLALKRGATESSGRRQETPQ